MPQDAEPRVRSRQGLIENAGGRLVCPVCREQRVGPAMTRTKLPWVSVLVDTASSDVGITARQAPDEGIEYDFDFRCTNGHGFGVHLVVGLDGAAVVTEWIEEDGERDA